METSTQKIHPPSRAIGKRRPCAPSSKMLLGTILYLFLAGTFLFGCSHPEQTDKYSPTSQIEVAKSTAIPSPNPTVTPTPDPVWSATTLRERSFGDIYQITLDHDGNVWSSGSGGIIRWDPDTGSYDTFNVEAGMPGYSGSEILTDTQGQIWVNWVSSPLRGYGVSRYSQGEWTHFETADGLADNKVNDMALADDGKLWFSTENGISSFDGESWASYTMEDGLPSNAVGIITTSPDGTVWAQTDSGVTSFDGMRWVDHNRMTDVKVNDIAITQDGRVWFATSDRIRFYDGEDWYWSLGNGLRLLPSHEYRSFAVATDGTLWARALNSLAVFDGNRWYWFTKDTGLHQIFGNGLHAMQDGSIWVPTMTNGLLRVSNWRFIDEENAVALFETICTGDIGVELSGTFSIEDLEKKTCLDGRNYGEPALETADGDLIFVASQDILSPRHDLVILRKTGEYDVHTIDEIERDPNQPSSKYGVGYVLSDGKSLWVSYGGLYKYNSQGWQNLSQGEQRLYPTVIELGPDGRVWVGSKHSLSVWDDQGWTHWAEELDDGSFEEMEVAAIDFHDQDLWVLDKRGLSRLYGGDLQEPAWTTIEPASWEDETGAGDMRFLEIDSQGGIWIGGEAAYPAYYDGVDWAVYPKGLFEDGYLTALAVAPDDSVWIGIRTNRGWGMTEELNENEYRLLHFDGIAWSTYEEAAGHPDVGLNDILITPDDRIWVSYDGGGVVRYDGKGTSWDAFNTLNNVLSSDYVRHIFMEADGTLWFGLGDGYARYGPPEE